MSMFQQLIECFNNWDEETFKELHHEDFMFIRETELLNRDEHVSNVSKLVKEPAWNWQHVATLIQNLPELLSISAEPFRPLDQLNFHQ